MLALPAASRWRSTAAGTGPEPTSSINNLDTRMHASPRPGSSRTSPSHRTEPGTPTTYSLLRHRVLMRPAIVLVSGAPGAGKTTLARPLAAALGFALLSKDHIKETLRDAMP